ncbi:transglutaminase [Paenibacillus oenotherae]|uniref:Transglutaminase n=1 Tax=Paenibacillus oenotherae TaxID=1435645 RepID=A0ABS7D1E7_9BACL|nr:transglutaminase-like domain-containing protein [Paenibacillus oenotherae]MBW7473770.1 transglutaminase [Paenibacillus oenotherae]
MTSQTQSFSKWFSLNWYAQLSAIFSVLVVFAWIRSFEGYWWAETYTIVHCMLLTSLVAVMLIPSKWFSTVIQLIALFIVNVALTGFEWGPFEGQKGKIGDWTSWLWAQVEQLMPFLWISLVIWAALQAILICSKHRLGIIGIISFSLLSLAVADSLFTPVYLWGEIALMVFIGLGWLVANHFLNFKQKHPESWEHLLEYPLSLFLPVLLIITLVMGAGLFVPSIKPILTDPYTAWKEARGEEVPTFIGDKGEGENGGKGEGDTSSGYSRNDENLGNGFKFDYSPIMDITTTRKSYWRGETRALYTGSGWEEAPEEKGEQAVRALAPGQSLDAGSIGDDVETIQVDQSVNMLGKDKYPVLFGASPVSEVVSVNEIDSYLPSLEWLPQSWELRLPAGKSAYPDKYSIISHVPVLDEKKLRSVAESGDSSSVSDMYLQLPSGLPSRVSDLALEISRDGATPYDKVRAIESYLQSNFKYTNEPDLSKKESKDFVDAFLFEMKEGYCDYYSTAMAVLTRSIGIPARWVKGYAPGSMPIDPETLRLEGTGVDVNPEGKGTYTVRNADAHSWVEVYFEGYGWFPFEPTAGFSFPYAMAQNQSLESMDTDNAATTEKDGASSTEFKVPAWGFAVVAGLLLAALIVWQRRQIIGLWQRYRMNAITVNERIVKDTDRLIRYGRRKGLTSSANETVRETMTHWAERRPLLLEELSFIITIFEKAMYSKDTISKEEAEVFDTTMKSIRERIS